MRVKTLIKKEYEVEFEICGNRYKGVANTKPTLEKIKEWVKNKTYALINFGDEVVFYSGHGMLERWIAVKCPEMCNYWVENYYSNQLEGDEKDFMLEKFVLPTIK